GCRLFRRLLYAIFNSFINSMNGPKLVDIHRHDSMMKDIKVLIPRMPSVCLRLVSLRSEEHTSELQSRFDLVCRLLLEKKKTSCTTSDVSLLSMYRQPD